jgi:hypothetical protein
MLCREEKASLPENFRDDTRERGGWCRAIFGVLMDGAENMESWGTCCRVLPSVTGV